MAIFTFAATKGGEGKSTNAVQAATGIALGDVENRVLGVDGDKKQTSMLLSLTQRAEKGYPGVPAIELSDGATLRAQVPLLKANYDHVIIDVGAKDSGALRAALTITDVLMVPFTPRSYALWAYENILELVHEAQEVRKERDMPPIRVVPFLNMADPSGDDNDAAVVAIAAYGFPVAPVRIGRRKAIERASATGLNVSEARPADQNAREEIGSLVQLMLKLGRATVEP